MKKKPMKKSIVVLATVYLLAGCAGKGDASKQPETAESTPQEVPATATEATATAALLQGKWQSTDDETNFVEFTGTLRREISEGMTDWDEEEYVLSGKCENASDKESAQEPEQDKYISCAKSDMCWYIDFVDENTLNLVYMARGNTLSYTRAE